MNTLVCPQTILQRLLQALVAEPQRVALARLGLRACQPDHEWLVRDFSLVDPDSQLPHSSQDPLLRVALTDDLPAARHRHLLEARTIPGVAGFLYLGDGSWRARLWGAARIGEGEPFEPFDYLSLVGPGLHRVSIGDIYPDLQSSGDPARATWQSDYSRSRWSRTIGALGGEEIWRRLVDLRVGIVGCGRTGSLVAVSLARLGVRELTLVDPDALEPHNLGEMDGVTDADLGYPKAESIAEHLEKLAPGLVSAHPVVASVAEPAGLLAARECDVLFSCPDDDAARLTAGIVATLYHKVLVDVGTGIAFEAPGADEPAGVAERLDRRGEGDRRDGQTRSGSRPRLDVPISLPEVVRVVAAEVIAVGRRRGRVMGSDVRLILPGDGCLLCRGGLVGYTQAVEDLVNRRLPTGLRTGRGWRDERAGSLRSLNQVAAGLGLQLLEDLVAARLPGSTWAHLEFDGIGRLRVEYPETQSGAGSDTSPCPLCARAGLGDLGLGLTRETLAR